jgi:hypothetical protein
MPSQLRITLATIGLALMSPLHVCAAKAQQKVLTNEQSQIVDTVNTMFTAVRTDDAAKLNSVIAPDFYMFDGGHRFKGEAIMALVKAQQVAGKRYEWSVTEPHIHISGNTAWIRMPIRAASLTRQAAWINSGWNLPSWRNRQVPGGSSLSTAPASQHQRTENDEIARPKVHSHSCR